MNIMLLCIYSKYKVMSWIERNEGSVKGIPFNDWRDNLPSALKALTGEKLEVELFTDKSLKPLNSINVSILTLNNPTMEQLYELTGFSWEFSREETLKTCIDKNRSDYKVVSKSAVYWDEDIEVSLNDRSIYKWTGHHESKFIIVSERLYYCSYTPASTGCSLVCVNLKSGKKEWTTHLYGMGPLSHSKYRNEVFLKIKDGKAIVCGIESAGKYFELIDLSSGKIIKNINWRSWH